MISQETKGQIEKEGFDLYPQRYNMSNIDINQKERKAWITAAIKYSETKQDRELAQLKGIAENLYKTLTNVMNNTAAEGYDTKALTAYTEWRKQINKAK